MEFAKSRILIYTAATLLVVYLVLLLGTTFHSQGLEQFQYELRIFAQLFIF